MCDCSSCLPAWLALATSCVHAEAWISRAPRVGPDVFPITAWSGPPSDIQSPLLMKEAGLNVTGFCKAEELEKVCAAGLTCFVTGTALDVFVARESVTGSES